tara:strand:- start:363500 stop:364009 length:510 start_codon:yes stop_codon:yes gene_type:complete
MMWAKVIGLTTAAGLCLAAVPAYSMDSETMTEIRRLDQNMSDLNRKMESIMRDIRELQRGIDKIGKESSLASKNAEETSDALTRTQNTDIANLVAVDKQIAQRLNALAKHMEEQTPTWNWGSETRSCDDVGKHQQIQSVRSADGQFTLRYLCFDGRPLHLGTEVNLPPQ